MRKLLPGTSSLFALPDLLCLGWNKIGAAKPTQRPEFHCHHVPRAASWNSGISGLLFSIAAPCWLCAAARFPANVFMLPYPLSHLDIEQFSSLKEKLFRSFWKCSALLYPEFICTQCTILTMTFHTQGAVRGVCFNSINPCKSYQLSAVICSLLGYFSVKDITVSQEIITFHAYTTYLRLLGHIATKRETQNHAWAGVIISYLYRQSTLFTCWPHRVIGWKTHWNRLVSFKNSTE